MKFEAIIRQKYTTKWFKNRMSGHEWSEDTLLNKWEIISGGLLVETCNSFEKAERLRVEWQAFEDKFHNDFSTTAIL